MEERNTIVFSFGQEGNNNVFNFGREGKGIRTIEHWNGEDMFLSFKGGGIYKNAHICQYIQDIKYVL